MLNIEIHDETSQLETVILGIAESYGVEKQSSNNPKSMFHRKNGTYPKEEDVLLEVKSFEDALVANGVQVLRPTNIQDQNQIFTRDIGFVIGDFFIKANMKKESRKVEINGISHITNSFKILTPPDDAFIEGGDIVLWKDYIFVGKSDRTNDAGYEFLKQNFKSKKVVQIPLFVSDDYQTNVLHLDCAFQPIGDDFAIFYADGFSVRPDALLDCFKKENLIQVNQQQMIDMYPNIFSISQSKVVIEKSFVELKTKLLQKGFDVIEVNYSETSKLRGLLRCSTLPLKRKY